MSTEQQIVDESLVDEEIDYPNTNVLVVRDISAERTAVAYPANEMKGLPEKMALAVGDGSISWSKEEDRLFVQIKSYEPEDQEEEESEDEEDDESTEEEKPKPSKKKSKSNSKR